MNRRNFLKGIGLGVGTVIVGVAVEAKVESIEDFIELKSELIPGKIEDFKVYDRALTATELDLQVSQQFLAVLDDKGNDLFEPKPIVFDLKKGELANKDIISFYYDKQESLFATDMEIRDSEGRALFYMPLDVGRVLDTGNTLRFDKRSIDISFK